MRCQRGETAPRTDRPRRTAHHAYRPSPTKEPQDRTCALAAGNLLWTGGVRRRARQREAVVLLAPCIPDGALRTLLGERRQPGHRHSGSYHCGLLERVGRSGQQARVLGLQFEDEFSEQGIGPGEPFPREAVGIVTRERFVDEAGAGVRPLKSVEAKANLAIIGARQRPLDDA